MGNRGLFPLGGGGGVEQPGHEADYSPPSSDMAKNAWSYTFTPPVCLHGMVLSYAQGFYLYFYFNNIKMKSTNYEAYYIIFSTPLLLPLSKVHILSFHILKPQRC
jgi:hypothetical protein